MRCVLGACGAILLAACQQQPAPGGETQVIDLAEAKPRQAEPLDSPDTSLATWSVDESGQSIRFGNADEPPLLTLECRLDSDPPQFAIIRHAPALPGETALFAVMGNGHASRLLADATLGATSERREWHWEAVLPADDPQLEMFIGPGDMRATLPGKGAVAIAPSRIPGQFVEWCRAGGQVVEAEEEERAQDAEGETG